MRVQRIRDVLSDADTARVAAASNPNHLVQRLRFVSPLPGERDPYIQIEFCAADFCVQVLS